jgi:hypothetical protein
MPIVYPIGADQGTDIINVLDSIATSLENIRTSGISNGLNNAIDNTTIIVNTNGTISVGSVPTSSLQGVISSDNLPSYVDDVIEGYMHQGRMFSDSEYTQEIIGESSKIYVDLLTDTTYR